MSSAASSLAPGTVISLTVAPKKSWGQGDVREIASGSLSETGELIPSISKEPNALDWRLSVASIEAAGKFTPYTGFDRTLTVIIGELLELTIDGETHPVELYRPLKFSGDATTIAALPTGNVLALNLITRRGTVRGNVRIIELSRKIEQHLFGAQFGILLQGQATMSFADTQTKLEVRDTVIGGKEDSPRISGRGFMAVVSLDPA